MKSFSPKLFKNNAHIRTSINDNRENREKGDKYDDIIKSYQREFDSHKISCGKIYEKLIKYKNTEAYSGLVTHAKALTNFRFYNIHIRLKKSLSNISFLHDTKFSFLYLFIGNAPIIDSKTVYFLFSLNYEHEDMSKIYVHCNLMRGASLKKDYQFYNFEDLKNFISAHIISYYNKK